jgi:hypothetical protein
MPNFDAGHYFLTALLPIDNRSLARDNRTLSSPVRIVRRALSVLPKAVQSPATQAAFETYGVECPFARNLRTHFLRIVVIDDVVFNGRIRTDAIRVALNEERLDPTVAKPSDQLRCPYLLVAIDFDAKSGEEAELDGYLTELWEQMPRELGSVFEHCYGFGSVATARQFADFIKRGQIETTMPFNDYWEPAPALSSDAIWPGAGRFFSIAGGVTALAVGLTVLLFVLRIIVLVIDAAADSPALRSIAAVLGTSSGWLGLVGLIGIAVLAVGAFVLYRRIVRAAEKPFPSGQRSDLRSVLKALYLQQKFTAFAVEAQGLAPAALHARFADFLATHKPGNLSEPTQKPGVVRS